MERKIQTCSQGHPRSYLVTVNYFIAHYPAVHDYPLIPRHLLSHRGLSPKAGLTVSHLHKVLLQVLADDCFLFINGSGTMTLVNFLIYGHLLLHPKVAIKKDSITVFIPNSTHHLINVPLILLRLMIQPIHSIFERNTCMHYIIIPLLKLNFWRGLSNKHYGHNSYEIKLMWHTKIVAPHVLI